MKILITTGIFEPESGGPATYAPRIAEKLVEAGHEVAVVTYSATRSYDGDAAHGFPIVRIVRRGKLSNYLRFFFALLWRLPRYDLVYSLDWLAAGLPAALSCGIWRRPFVVRVGGGYIWEKYLQDGHAPVTLDEFYRRGLHMMPEYATIYRIIRFVLARASHIVFNSERQRILSLSPYGLAEEQTSVIVNPVPQPIPGVVRGTPTKEIIFFGRLIVMKNVEVLIDAFRIANLPALWHLAIIGDGPQRGALERRIKDAGMGERIALLPAMRRDELYARVKDCAYAVIPSWTDISPNQAAELLSLAIPFVITRETYVPFLDQVPETFDPHVAEELAEIMRRLADGAEYERFSKAFGAIEYAYSWDDALREHMDVFSYVTMK